MPKPKKWYKISAAADDDDTAEISIFGDIGFSWWNDGVEAGQFKEDFDAIKDKARINILINSPGGSVFEGIAIHNIIATQRAKVHIEVIALAASAASVIALAGSSLKIDTASFFMIHNVWSWAMGDAIEMRKTADKLDKIGGELVNIYEAHSNLSADEIQEFMDAETWFTADEAIEHGFADESVEHEDIAASVSVDARYGYEHIPERFRGCGDDIKTPDNIRDFEGLLRDSGFSRKQSTDIAAHGFEPVQGDPEPEGVQGDPDFSAEETKPHENIIPYGTLLRMRENKSFLKEGY